MDISVYTIQQLLHELNLLQIEIDKFFRKIVKIYPQAVTCTSGCDDCCHALFDLSFLETIALALSFQQLQRKERRKIRHRANKAAEIFDKTITFTLANQREEKLTHILSLTRIPCPLLANNKCLLYKNRPLTCRLYGIPIAIDGISRICYRSRFTTGQKYPTININLVYTKLKHLSQAATYIIPMIKPIRRDIARTVELTFTYNFIFKNL